MQTKPTQYRNADLTTNQVRTELIQKQNLYNTDSEIQGTYTD